MCLDIFRRHINFKLNWKKVFRDIKKKIKKNTIRNTFSTWSDTSSFFVPECLHSALITTELLWIHIFWLLGALCQPRCWESVCNRTCSYCILIILKVSLTVVFCKFLEVICVILQNPLKILKSTGITAGTKFAWSPSQIHTILLLQERIRYCS